MKSGIYKIMCIHTKKIYIGQSKDVKSRFKYHLKDLKNGKHGNKHFQYAFQKYGKDAFYFEILEHCEEEKLNERELYFIELFKSYDPELGFNILRTPYFREAIKIRWSEPEFRKIMIEKIRQNMKQKFLNGEKLGILTEESKQKSRESCSTPEHLKLRSELAYKQLENEEYRLNNLEVLKKARALPSKIENLKKHNDQLANNEIQIKKMSENTKKYWSDENHRKMRTEAIRKSMKNPEVRKKQSESAKIQMQDPKMKEIIKSHNERQKTDREYRKRQSEKIKALWNDPEYARKALERKEKQQNDPEYKKKQAQKTKDLWKSPEYRKKVLEAREKSKKAILNV